MQAADIVQIVNVVNLYALALDSHRYALFEQVFTEDVRVDFGAGAAFSGRALLQEAFRTIHAGFTRTQHMVMGHSVAVQGERAHCGSYVHARFHRVLDGAEALFDSTGWYDDVLISTPQGWRIAERTSRMVSAGGDVRVMQAMPHAPVEFDLLSLAEEADAGRVGFLAAFATAPSATQT